MLLFANASDTKLVKRPQMAFFLLNFIRIVRLGGILYIYFA